MIFFFCCCCLSGQVMNITCSRVVYISMVIIFGYYYQNILACCTVNKWLVLCMLCSSTVWQYKQYKFFLLTCGSASFFLSYFISQWKLRMWLHIVCRRDGEVKTGVICRLVSNKNCGLSVWLCRTNKKIRPQIYCRVKFLHFFILLLMHFMTLNQFKNCWHIFLKKPCNYLIQQNFKMFLKSHTYKNCSMLLKTMIVLQETM